MPKTKQDFMEDEGVNYKHVRLNNIGDEQITAEINIKKFSLLLGFLVNQKNKDKFLTIKNSSIKGCQAEFESLKRKEVKFIEEIDGQKFNVSKDLLHFVTVRFSDNTVINGQIIFDQNKHRRLSDCINNLGQFFPLFVGNRILLINNEDNSPLRAIRHK